MNIELLPKEITRKHYIMSSIDKVLKEDEIDNYVTHLAEDHIKDLSKSKLVSITKKKLKEYYNDVFDNTLKSGINSAVIHVKIYGKQTESSLESKEETVLTFINSLTKIIDTLKKDRPNDFKKVYENIINNLNDDSWRLLDTSMYLEEYKDITDEELSTSERKDKLTNYIYNTCSVIYHSCEVICSDYARLKANEYIKEHKKEVDNQINEELKDININTLKQKYKEEFKPLLRILIKNYVNNINFVDYNNKIYLVNPNTINIDMDKNKIKFESGRGKFKDIELNLGKNDSLKRYGNTFTYVID